MSSTNPEIVFWVKYIYVYYHHCLVHFDLKRKVIPRRKTEQKIVEKRVDSEFRVGCLSKCDEKDRLLSFRTKIYLYDLLMVE